MRRWLLKLSLFCVVTTSLAAWGQAPLSFVPINPCRLVDTRLPLGPLGGPSITGGTSRDFNPQLSTSCAVPSTAAAYSFNVTVVPSGSYLGYLTVWPAGATQPVVSTLNSFDGRIKANAAIIAAGTAGAVSVFATDTTDVVVDIDGYFVQPGNSSGLQFYPLEGTPPGGCVVVDTTQAKGPLAGPSLAAATARSFPVSTSTCFTTDPNAQFAEAYSLNITAVPHTTLGYLTVWNSDFTQPLVSTLNAPTGTTVSNAALILAASGSISAYPSDAIDLMVTTNGFWADPNAVGSAGLSLYEMVPCRALDTRTLKGNPFSGTNNVDVVASGCVQGTPQGYVMNATVVPTTKLAYLDVSDPGLVPPAVDTLHALDAAVTSNMAIVTSNNSGWYTGTGFPDGSVDYVASSPASVILDVTATLDFATLQINPVTLPPAYDGISYSFTLTGKGGTPPYTWAAGGLPTGLTINTKTGVISGTTNATPGNFSVAVTLTDSKSVVANATLPLTVDALTGLQVTPQTLPGGNVGVLYNATVGATGGIQPYTWSVSVGSLPPGVSLSTGTVTPYNALLTGTPTTPGTYSFSLLVTDSQSKPATATAPFSITVK